MSTYISISDARRAAVGRVDDQSVQDQTVSGRNIIQGVGRVLFAVKFPVVFAGRPIPSFGAEIDPQTPLSALDGRRPSPTAIATVVMWEKFGAIEGVFEGYHTGATIIAVLDGSKEQYMWVDWQFRGPALRNPVKTDEVIVL